MRVKDPAAGGPRKLPRILLVEDHQDTRQMYAEFLSREFDVATAPDGTQALDLMRTHRFDLVITDLSLPGMDGFALTALIRKDAAMAGVPVICLSGYSGHPYEQQARDAGCDRLLQKPCMPDTLAHAASELLHPLGQRSVRS